MCHYFTVRAVEFFLDAVLEEVTSWLISVWSLHMSFRFGHKLIRRSQQLNVLQRLNQLIVGFSQSRQAIDVLEVCSPDLLGLRDAWFAYIYSRLALHLLEHVHTY